MPLPNLEHNFVVKSVSPEGQFNLNLPVAGDTSVLLPELAATVYKEVAKKLEDEGITE